MFSRILVGLAWFILIHRLASVKHWQAKANGKPIPIFPCDLMFMAAIIPPGTAQVSLYYLPLWLPLFLVFAIVLLLTVGIIYLSRK